MQLSFRLMSTYCDLYSVCVGCKLSIMFCHSKIESFHNFKPINMQILILRDTNIVPPVHSSMLRAPFAAIWAIHQASWAGTIQGGSIFLQQSH